MDYMSEILARTEEYFYPRFLDYGDAADYEARLEAFHVALDKRK
jgi:hypothetical protein